MSCICYSVISKDGSWIVGSEEINHGPYMSIGMALRVATSNALAKRSLGQRSRISIHNRTGVIVAEYCLCGDHKIANGQCPHMSSGASV